MRDINKKQNLKIMQSFDIKTIPELDTCVLGALELFNSEKIPKIDINYKRPLVVGSGNAEATAKIIFSDKDAVFASESDFENKLRAIKEIDGVVIVSASGGKHAPIIAEVSKRYKKNVTLITNTKSSEASKYSDKEYVFPKQKEPYTYNTSTYLGMILGHTKESAKKIYEYLEKLDSINFEETKKFNKYYIILPPKFSEFKRMIQVKFIELFGRQIARDVETSEYVKHATTVIPADEMFIVFGNDKIVYGKNQINISLPKDADYGTMLAVGYYTMGKIQRNQYPWFKENIDDYTKRASKLFNSTIKPIVE